MKVLSVASGLPYPPNDGTRVRTWHFLRQLSAVADVTLLTWVDDEDDPDLALVREGITKLVAIKRLPSGAGRLRIRARSVARGLPPFVLWRTERQGVPAFDDDFDIVIAEDDSALFLIPRVEAPVLVHRHNIFSDTIRSLIDSDSLGAARTLKWRLELSMWDRFDKRLSEMSDISVVTTPESAKSLRAIVPGHRVEVVTNGTYPPIQQLVPGDHPRAVFIGTMNYEPNADAAVRFARRVWPNIRKAHPTATFDVIGRWPMASVRRIRGEGVNVVGEVDDIVKACDGARLGVIPLFAGSGLKNKTIELMAMGLPVVATAQGCEGIEATEADGLFRGRSDSDLAQLTNRLLFDRDLAVAAGRAARAYVETQFTWDEPAKKYVELVHSIATIRKAGTR